MRVHIRNALSYQEGKGRGLKKFQIRTLQEKTHACISLGSTREDRGDMGWGRDLGTLRRYCLIGG